MPDKDLGDAMGSRVLHDGFDRIVALEHFHPGASFASASQILFDRPVLILGRVRRSHVNGRDIAMKARRALAGARDHAIRIGVGRQTDKEALMGRRCGLDIVRSQITLQSGVNHVGGKNQGHLPQGGEFRGRVFRGSIDDHDFVRLLRNSRGMVSLTGLPVNFSAASR